MFGRPKHLPQKTPNYSLASRDQWPVEWTQWLISHLQASDSLELGIQSLGLPDEADFEHVTKLASMIDATKRRLLRMEEKVAVGEEKMRLAQEQSRLRREFAEEKQKLLLKRLEQLQTNSGSKADPAAVLQKMKDKNDTIMTKKIERLERGRLVHSRGSPPSQGTHSLMKKS